MQFSSMLIPETGNSRQLYKNTPKGTALETWY
jgi:hypothetical protein